jgi:hypothetical protein
VNCFDTGLPSGTHAFATVNLAAQAKTACPEPYPPTVLYDLKTMFNSDVDGETVCP